MWKTLTYVACTAIMLTLTSTGLADKVVGDWENDMNGWELLANDAPAGSSTSFATQGVTRGDQSLKVVIPAGGWKQVLMLNINALGLTADFQKNTKFSVDITRLAADWTGTPADGHSGFHFIINAGGNGWQIWEQGDYLGWWKYDQGDQTQTITWDYSAILPKIDFANIWWLELRVVSNYDTAYTAGGIYYLDNALFSGSASTGKSTDFVLGNWEQDMDRWVVGGGADVLFNDHNGVTLDNYSADVWVETGAWAGALTMNLLDPNNTDILAAFRANTKITADITHLIADWPVDDIPPWNGTHFIVNTDAAAVPSFANGYRDLGYRAGWSQNDGDRTDSVTWDYGQVISDINANFDKVTYLELQVVVNANSADYAGWVWFYLDNMKLSGGGITLNPQPASGAKDVNVETLLRWNAGAQAQSHNLYLGTSRNAVAAAQGASDPTVLFVPVDGTSFDPNLLKFNTQYFWRVDAVNDTNPDSPWAGPVWDFTTGNFLVVDDFESYTEDSPNRVFQTWVDGYGFSEDEFFPGGNKGNGSDAGVGHDVWTPGSGHPTIAETATVHGGREAMPLYYDNKGAGYSEARRTWAQPQNWTVNGFNLMSLFIYGKADNVADAMYVSLEDSTGKAVTVAVSNPSVFTTEAWTECTIPLASFTGVDMAAVTKMAIGVGSRTAVSKAAGMVLIDDIRIGIKPVGLVAHYKLDGNLKDSSGNGHDGTLAGDPNLPAKYVAGPTGLGQGMLFDGTGGHQNVELGTFNPSAATGKITIALWAKWDGASDQWQGLIGKRDGWALDNMMWHVEVNRDNGTIGFARYDSYPNSGGATLPTGVWTHVAVTFDGTTARFYINGAETGNGGFSFGLDTESALHFGSDDPNGGNAFNGALDDVRIYDTVLSAAEIKTLAGK